MQCSSNRVGQLWGVLYPSFFLRQCSPATLEDIKSVFTRMLPFLWFVRRSSLSHLRHVGDADGTQSSPPTDRWSAMVSVTFLASPQPAWTHDRCAAKKCARCSQREFLCPLNLTPHLQPWKSFWAFQKLLHMIILLGPKWNSFDMKAPPPHLQLRMIW